MGPGDDTPDEEEIIPDAVTSQPAKEISETGVLVKPLIAQVDYEGLFTRLTKRYGGIQPDALEQLLCALLIPIKTLNKTIIKIAGQGHYRATFTVAIDDANYELMTVGRTGKFVPKSYVDGGEWREIAKGRIIEVDDQRGIATGEIYTGSGPKSDLEQALESLAQADYLEIDRYGASAKILSALVEYSLSLIAREEGYKVKRMPEDMARHLGAYCHYDFEFVKGNITKKVEVKSLWGTNTKYARLIRSLSKDNPTSSCRFDTQDLFAVSLFLRTGNVRDFAFARSVAKDEKPYGLPRASKYPEHVHQNPVCQIGDGTWFGSIHEVWDLA